MSLPLQRYISLPKQFPRERRPKLWHLFFNVNDNRVLVTNPAWNTHNVGTIEVVFNITDISANRTIWSYFESWNEYMYLSVDALTGRLRMRFVIGGVSTDYIMNTVGNSLRAGLYYGIAITQDGSDLKGFVNGHLSVTQAGVTRWFHSPALTAGSDVEIGLFQTFGDWVGAYALVRYYSRALSEAELQENMVQLLNPSRTNLEMNLEAEEGQGATVFDKSGNGKDGVITGAVWDRLKKWEVRAQTI